jgi:hypothetical protein
MPKLPANIDDSEESKELMREYGREAQKALSRLRRRLYLELRSPERADPVCSGLLLASEFELQEIEANQIQMTGLAFLGTKSGFRKKCEPCDLSGAFHVVVVDRENGLDSNSVPITLSAPSAGQKEAATLFRGVFPEAIELIWEQKVSDTKTADTFKKILRDYPETTYGKYAKAALALTRARDTWSQHNNKGGAAVWKPVATDLKGSLDRFEAWHPLRERILFELCKTQVLADELGQAKQSIAKLDLEFPTGRTNKKAKRLLAEIEKLERKQSPSGS